MCSESVGDSSDDEPLSKAVKPGKKCSDDTRKPETVSHTCTTSHISLSIASEMNLLTNWTCDFSLGCHGGRFGKENP